jgi:lipopolysaccharide export system ATP-binding protein|tara:strand:+ start:1450 stop:2253 length:804 start_codon:yes stop_codon:yes gene_type:complete
LEKLKAYSSSNISSTTANIFPDERQIQLKNGLLINSISKTYDNKLVVNQVSMNLERGEAVGLLGPNGAGKTTCFYMIAGLINCDKGDILLNKSSISHLPMHIRARKGIGYLPQESSIFKGLTVEENILSILEILNVTTNQKYEILEDLLAEFNINQIRNSYGATLSGGERRRVEIARALATNPSYILLDEPLAGIDPIAVNDVKNLIYKLKAKNIGVLITDHNVRETLDIVDRAYILFNGSLIMTGTPSQVKSDRRVRDVYLGNSFF